ncbi:PilZ domain-containing protein [Govanella unica]|uniref:PilZ domain-containing protein n=1 Tax=Govanella unica TaxID=2975056 RepID=A0A9X3Z8B6_9PROT|nr:PilZ domain-containing protein [Govania unica]MDA5194854.1 PilZ domain-containing protein [Govania unica]
MMTKQPPEVCNDLPDETIAVKSQRRRFARITAMQIAIVECGERYFTVNLLDLSSNGARIQVGPAPNLDTMTHIIIPDIGGRLRCERIWQEGKIVGLRFLDKPYEVVQKMPASMRRHMVPLALD